MISPHGFRKSGFLSKARSYTKVKRFLNKRSMKRFIAITAGLLVSAFTIIYAQPMHKNCDEGWRDRLRCERVASLTESMDMSPEVAEKFWPVYNEIQKQKMQAQNNVMETYRSLEEAVNGGSSKAAVKKALDAYLEALEAKRSVNSECAGKLRTVLTDEELAKFFVAEEKFRRAQIHKLRPGGPECDGKRPDAGRRPGDGRGPKDGRGPAVK